MTTLYGLAHVISGRVMRLDYAPPFGWKVARIHDRDSYEIIPAWLYYPVMVWRARWRAFEPLLEAGFWQMEAGDLWRNGHFTLRFWESFELLRAESRLPRSQFPAPINLWERLGWWVKERLVDDWNERMPRWT